MPVKPKNSLHPAFTILLFAAVLLQRLAQMLWGSIGHDHRAQHRARYCSREHHLRVLWQESACGLPVPRAKLGF